MRVIRCVDGAIQLIPRRSHFTAELEGGQKHSGAGGPLAPREKKRLVSDLGGSFPLVVRPSEQLL